MAGMVSHRDNHAAMTFRDVPSIRPTAAGTADPRARGPHDGPGQGRPGDPGRLGGYVAIAYDRCSDCFWSVVDAVDLIVAGGVSPFPGEDGRKQLMVVGPESDRPLAAPTLARPNTVQRRITIASRNPLCG